MEFKELIEQRRSVRKYVASVISKALVLNVAGPRESKSPGIQAKTKAFLSEVLWEV